MCKVRQNSLILVTGGAGFIGSHLVEELINHGHHVRVLDNFSTGSHTNLRSIDKKRSSLEIVRGDIRDSTTVNAAVQGVSCIFHQAAFTDVAASCLNPRLSFENNAQGTFNLFEAARIHSLKHVILASSAAVYGNGQKGHAVREGTKPMPLSPYGLDKSYAEQIAALYAKNYGMKATSLRYFNVYGARQNPNSPYAGVISVFIQCLKNGHPLTIYGDGTQVRDFISVKDVVQANLRAMERSGEGYQTFNVATGKETSINQLITILREHARETKSTLLYKEARPSDILYSLGDTRLASDRLGFSAVNQLRSGLESLWEAGDSQVNKNGPN